MHPSLPDQLTELGIAVMPGLLTAEMRSLCKEYLWSVKQRYAQRLGADPAFLENDRHHPDTFSFYSPLCTEVLLLNLLPTIEQVARVPLVPSYSYARTYYRNSFLEKHTDRRCSQFGISICLDKDEHDWPLVITDKTGQDRSIELGPGDAVMFLGMQLEHYRATFEGTAQTQIFLFYMPQNDALSHLYFDRRPSLGALPAP